MAFAWWRKKQYFQLNIGPYTFPVAPELTLLQAAIAHGVEIPHGCNVGCCGLCRCQLLSGQIDAPSAAEAFSLTPAELSQGIFLACQHKICADSVVKILPPPLSAHGSVVAAKPAYNASSTG